MNNKYQLILEYLDENPKDWELCKNEVKLTFLPLKKYVKSFYSSRKDFIKKYNFELYDNVLTNKSKSQNYEWDEDGTIFSYSWYKSLFDDNESIKILDEFVNNTFKIVSSILLKKGWNMKKDRTDNTSYIIKKFGKTEFVISSYVGDNDGNSLSVSDKNEYPRL